VSLEGRQLGEFVVREKISEGGFGDVYRAEQPALEREAVVKVLQARRKHDAVIVSRFMREARLASKLDHPYAAHIYAFGAEPDGILWIAMELVRGTPLDQVLAGGPMPLARFVPFLEQICEVVHSAHEKGIVHRDLKPGNVMVLSRAGRVLPKLLDFGLAKVVEGSGASVEIAPLAPDPTPVEAATLSDSRDALDATQDLPNRTAAGALLGTPAYMPPEQWRASAIADARTDLYALGILGWEMLMGRRPFPGETVDEVRAGHLHDPLPPLAAGLPAGLHAALARATAKDPAARFETVLELAAAVRAASGLGDVEAMPRLADDARDRALAEAPRPIAEAVLELDGARHLEQAREAMDRVARAAARTLGVIALACRARTGPGPARAADAGEVIALAHELQRRELHAAEWIELARRLTAPFRGRAELHPVPELVELLAGEDPFAPLAAAAGEAGAREALARGLPLLAELLERLGFLEAYPIVVRRGDALERWKGARRPARAALSAAGAALPEGAPALADWKDRPIVPLGPLARAAADLVLLERADERVKEWLRGHFPTGEGSPYRGLAPFRAEDAADFFGREAETRQLLELLRAAPLVAVVGAAGSGKTSFVQAGVIPRLPEGWRAVAVRPGAPPPAALPRRAGVTVFVVDPLDDLFTSRDDAGELQRFVAALDLVTPSRVIVTLRDTLLPRAEEAAAIRDAPKLVLATPAADDLRRILVEPARRAGAEFEDDDLPREVIAGVEREPGGLALLSFIAARLWERRDRGSNRLTRAAYRALGGARGLLAAHAGAVRDALLERLGPGGEALVEELVAARLLLSMRR
jgi:tRNA A-37 threonylcarbamoyl transferase component Bud32